MNLVDVSEFCRQAALCPACRTTLVWEKHRAVCSECHQEYPIRLGIPDLRWPRPETCNNRDLVDTLESQYSWQSFEQLTITEIGILAGESDLYDRYVSYRLNALDRGSRLEKMFLNCLASRFTLKERDAALNLGCGVGAGLESLSRDFDQVCGVDPYLPDLILARKMCDQEALHNVTLIQAYGQNLPLGSGTFNYASAQNVLEHLGLEARAVLCEVHRVLKPGGCFCADSRNRFDLFRPEPHVNLRLVGFLPRRLMPWYVRLRRGSDYRGVHLLSLPDVRRLMRSSFSDQWAVVLADVTAYGHVARWKPLLDGLDRLPLINALMLFFFPSHIVIGNK